MTRFIVKRLSVVVLTAVLVLGGSGVAFAYFTSAGSGSGSANIGTVGRVRPAASPPEPRLSDSPSRLRTQG
jgi:hypothetical protein